MECVPVYILIVHEIDDVVSDILPVMICYSNAVLQIIHEYSVPLTKVTRVNVLEFLDCFCYCILMLGRIYEGEGSPYLFKVIWLLIVPLDLWTVCVLIPHLLKQSDECLLV